MKINDANDVKKNSSTNIRSEFSFLWVITQNGLVYQTHDENDYVSYCAKNYINRPSHDEEEVLF